MNNNIYSFPDHPTLQEEAAAWLIKMDGDTPLSQQNQLELRAWHNQSPAHKEALYELAELWDKMNLLTNLSVPPGKVVG